VVHKASPDASKMQLLPVNSKALVPKKKKKKKIKLKEKYRVNKNSQRKN